MVPLGCCLLQVQDITLEITELLQWLDHVEVQLFSTQPSWGHPETAKDKLAGHLVSPLPSLPRHSHALEDAGHWPRPLPDSRKGRQRFQSVGRAALLCPGKQSH